MLLAIDIGNTNIVMAVYDGQAQQCFERVPTEQGAEALLNDLSKRYANISAIIVSSVVPQINDKVVQQCETFFNLAPHFVTYENIDIGIDIDTPEKLGADRMVGASAVVAYYSVPAVIVDFGTSTNFDVIDGQGRHCGGVLATGARLSLNALVDAAAQLPEIEIAKPNKVIGRDTKSAMQSGMYWGYVSMVEGVVRRIETEMGEKPFVIATGGLAPLFEGEHIFDAIDPDLIMKGLVHLHEVSEKKKNKKEPAQCA